MKIDYGKGTTEWGPGVEIELEGHEAALAILAYLTANGVHISGPTTICVNGRTIENASVYVDPSGSVVTSGRSYNGRGANKFRERINPC
jgi:hypothetical protein